MRTPLITLLCLMVLSAACYAVDPMGPILELDWGLPDGSIPTGPPPTEVIEIATPADIMLWGHVIWPGNEGLSFKMERVSLHYEIWGTGTPGSFVVEHIAQPGESRVVCTPFEWARITTNKPPCTYFDVFADLNMDQWGTKLISNRLTFHLVPEPSALLALLGGVAGLAGYRRRN